MARLGTVVRVVLWLAGFWRGRRVRLVVLCSGAVGLGGRVMARLRAVLCGTVTYGLVRLARLGRVLQGVV